MFSRLTLVLLLACNWTSPTMAETPLVLAELAANRAIADADLARAQAEQDLAQWKLDQLEMLRSRGHASWQEIAEQRVVVKKQAALTRAAEQYLAAVIKWQAGAADARLQRPIIDTESIRLYLPGSIRLVGWVPAEQASNTLVSRQLQQLIAEHEQHSNIDLLSMASAVEQAEHAVEVYSRLANTHHMQRANIKHRLAKAECDLAHARKEKGTIFARRIALLRRLSPSSESSSSIAQIGTTFVDFSDDRELARLVRTMAVEESTSVEFVAWRKQQRHAVSSRIEKLEDLLHYEAANPLELEQARAQIAMIDESINQSTSWLRMHQQIADEYDTPNSNTVANEVVPLRPSVNTDGIPDATLVRHLLEQKWLSLQTEADCTAFKAQRDYLAERHTRLERIEPSSRQPHELDHLRAEMQATSHLIEHLDRRIALLGSEHDRFLCQWKSQREDDYQFVQAGDDNFFSSEEVSAGKAFLAAVGFVGVLPKNAAAHAYLESPAILACLPDLVDRQQHSNLGHAGIGVSASYDSLRRRTHSGIGNAANDSSRLRREAMGLTYAIGLSRYAPFDLRQWNSDCLVSPQDYLRSVTAFESRIPSYSAEYAFGIRRLDSAWSSKYRRRANGYGSPWYLPGSPTNYRD